MRGRTVAVTAAVAAMISACGHPARGGQDPARGGQDPVAASVTEAIAQPVAADPRVGAVFLGDDQLHTCSAAVLHSATGDLILTAAHCLADGIDATFVPGFDTAAAPENTWHLDAVYLDPRWVTEQDPHADYAIARVSRETGGPPEVQAGGGLALGAAPGPGTSVTVTGYGMGVGGGPIGCRAATAVAPGGFPALPCEGLVAGVSGAPWISGSAVTGLIGGLDGGGCDEDLSYSPPFDVHVARLLARAEAGGPADAAPVAFDDGC